MQRDHNYKTLTVTAIAYVTLNQYQGYDNV